MSFEIHLSEIKGIFRALQITHYLDYSLDNKVYEIHPILRIQGKVFPDIALISNQQYNMKFDSVH